MMQSASDNLTTTASKGQPVRCRKRRTLERFDSTAEEPITVMTACVMSLPLTLAATSSPRKQRQKRTGGKAYPVLNGGRPKGGKHGQQPKNIVMLK